jgi:predicted nucleotide-binding protein (sugar kinase/HSP70/actin superfamily)
MTIEPICHMIGHYLTEAKNTLYCIAEDRFQAMTNFEEVTSDYIESLKREGEKMLATGLKDCALHIKKIPIKAKVDETPKVLIFGGINLANDHYPAENYLLEMGIIPKVVEYAEYIELTLSSFLVRFGFKRGYTTPKEQFDESLFDYSNFNKKELREAERAIRYKKTLEFFHSQCQLYRKIIEATGLLFDPQINFEDLLEKGNEFASVNGITETPMITGRFIHSLESGVYDGLINLSTFNCQPAMNSQPIIRPIANKSDIPYAALDCEGPWLSTNQLRLLETIAVQAKRVRRKKNELLLES